MGTLRRPIPSIRAALSTAEWVCSEQTISLRPVASRAAMMTASWAVEAVSSMWPCQPSGRPSSRATQSSVTCSSSVAAGALRHRKPTEFSVAASISARIPGGEDELAK